MKKHINTSVLFIFFVMGVEPVFANEITLWREPAPIGSRNSLRSKSNVRCD